MVDGRFREQWDKSIPDLSWSDRRFFDILGILKMDSSVQSTENSSPVELLGQSQVGVRGVTGGKFSGW